MNRKSSFPWRAFLKSVAAIAVPVALQNLLTTTGSMIDTIMLSSLGEETVGGVGLCAQFSSLMFPAIGDLSAAAFCLCRSISVQRTMTA